MKKTEVAESLREAIRTEETATALYLEHLSAVTLRSELEKEEIKLVRLRMDYLIAGNRAHRETLLKMLEKLEKESADDI